MAFAREIVQLVWLDPRDHRLQTKRINQVAVVEFEMETSFRSLLP
jgi:hypothetical protein